MQFQLQFRTELRCSIRDISDTFSMRAITYRYHNRKNVIDNCLLKRYVVELFNSHTKIDNRTDGVKEHTSEL
jgi:hypothetical protein